ncbi:MAG TPA: hypothetical protein ENI48_09320 [Thioploca sp.]|nr:hypothetical protein [Thioploca sp.]
MYMIPLCSQSRTPAYNSATVIEDTQSIKGACWVNAMACWFPHICVYIMFNLNVINWKILSTTA